MTDKIKKNHFREHIPNFVEGYDPTEISFDTQEELLSHELFKDTAKESGFDGFYINDNTLMYTTNKGTWWWVLGYIERPDLVDFLPWIAVETAEKYLTGQCYPQSAKLVLQETILMIDNYYKYISETGTEENQKYFALLNKRLHFLRERLQKSLNFLCSKEHEKKERVKK